MPAGSASHPSEHRAHPQRRGAGRETGYPAARPHPKRTAQTGPFSPGSEVRRAEQHHPHLEEPRQMCPAPRYNRAAPRPVCKSTLRRSQWGDGGAWPRRDMPGHVSAEASGRDTWVPRRLRARRGGYGVAGAGGERGSGVGSWGGQGSGDG